MKIGWLSAVLMLLCVILAACSPTAEAPSSLPAPSAESTLPQSEGGPKTAAEAVGSYAISACYINVTEQQGNLVFSVAWGVGDMETDTWSMSGSFDEATGIVSYSDAVRENVVYDANGKQTIVRVYEHGSGRFLFTADGLIWEDGEQGIADGHLFIKEAE